VPERLFVFIQMEFPWVLGPAEGRYLLRAVADAEPERVVVIDTLGAPRLPLRRDGTPRTVRTPMRGRLRGRTRPAPPDPAPVTTSRATVIDPVSVSAETQARAWLEELDREREVLAATAAVNRLLHSHRIASADPFVNEVSPAQALVIRAGWGDGERVADGEWLHARELTWRVGRARGGELRRGSRDRSAALRPQERLAALLGGRTTMLLCEELVLRARLDLDHARPDHAALQLDSAYAAAIHALREEGRQDLAIRVAELEKLQPRVAEQARAVLATGSTGPDQEVLEHALGRLEAALRARTAPGFNLG
jgi:hypothetical protein